MIYNNIIYTTVCLGLTLLYVVQPKDWKYCMKFGIEQLIKDPKIVP